ncbi:MAG: hemolysin family protein [Armatimonadetes bacterium]|nr:hemolysin family protein [Armatimonadota bacterium]
METSSPAGDLLGIVALLIASFIFSASEAAFLGAGIARIRQLAEQGDWRARLAEWMLRRRAYVLAVALVGITASNYSAERLATEVAVGYHPVWGPVVAMVVMTTVVVLVCEIFPIHLGARIPEAVATRAAPLLAAASVVLAPAVAILWSAGQLMLRLMGVRQAEIRQRVSEEHLRALIDVGTAQGVLDEDERLWLHRVLNFGDLTAGQVMTPRTDLVAVPAEMPVGEALRLGLDTGHSRLPVYEDMIDTVVGMFHLKDALPLARSGQLDQPVSTIARPALFVPDSLPADELLRRLQSARRTAAIVKDEFGGTAGLVTVEDLLEEIVGSIQDEYDAGEEPEIVQQGPDQWLASGLAKPQAVEEATGVELPQGSWDTLGGFLMSLTEQLPKVGDRVVWGPLEFTVAEMDEARLEKVIIHRLSPGEAPEPPGGSPQPRGVTSASPSGTVAPPGGTPQPTAIPSRTDPKNGGGPTGGNPDPGSQQMVSDG